MARYDIQPYEIREWLGGIPETAGVTDEQVRAIARAWDRLTELHADLDPDDLARTSWHWFKEKVEGLLSMPPRTFLPDGAPLPPNRIQLALSELA